MMCTTCNPGLQTLPQLSRDPAVDGLLLEVFTRFLTESDRLEREFNLPQQWLSDIYKQEVNQVNAFWMKQNGIL